MLELYERSNQLNLMLSETSENFNVTQNTAMAQILWLKL